MSHLLQTPLHSFSRSLREIKRGYPLSVPTHSACTCGRRKGRPCCIRFFHTHTFSLAPKRRRVSVQLQHCNQSVVRSQWKPVVCGFTYFPIISLLDVNHMPIFNTAHHKAHIFNRVLFKTLIYESTPAPGGGSIVCLTECFVGML